MNKYFYTPIFYGLDDRIVPGKDDGAGVIVSAGDDLTLGVSAPKCDRGVEQRFVVETPESFDILLGWMERTKEEINNDYTGLIP